MALALSLAPVSPLLGQRGPEQREVVQKQGECHYCGIQSGRKTDADHIDPRSIDGNTTPENTVAACPECNRHWKSDMPREMWEEFVKWVCGKRRHTIAGACAAEDEE